MKTKAVEHANNRYMLYILEQNDEQELERLAEKLRISIETYEIEQMIYYKNGDDKANQKEIDRRSQDLKKRMENYMKSGKCTIEHAVDQLPPS